MAAVASRNTEYTAVDRAGYVSPAKPDGVAGDDAILAPWIIEISDDDYRSFCFPCHALEDVECGNPGA